MTENCHFSFWKMIQFQRAAHMSIDKIHCKGFIYSLSADVIQIRLLQIIKHPIL